ncbi:M20/M25/M40 family metallo-hydrolase [Primorskyibacter aestuariivivens]|uniref:M20/M25/M40 family metallo-hydrolase n=1 Tax=Primorskyibacter aestuariivivens TaxID=1888912 RepID=UPI002300F948|nr:M20/M25/M40 family metallo-hydrolase [Primorskyibacter aestuariivivens]MDA7430911.1 M20/M25/M40 family metallo-hydrolase [Primorskyibacter aestuariivivens]
MTDKCAAAREAAIDRAVSTINEGDFLRSLSELVEISSESQDPDKIEYLFEYLEHVSSKHLDPLGFRCRIFDNPVEDGGPILIAERIENPKQPTVLFYGHGDVVSGMEGQWTEGLDPWKLKSEGNKIFGRGVADNKGQHLVSFFAWKAILEERKQLGFNIRLLLETSEEIGSKGLREFCRENGDLLRADFLVGSDGPRLSAELPTLFMGSRGNMTFDLEVSYRESPMHSGNWGGLLKDPIVRLANALSLIVDGKGRITVPGWEVTSLNQSVKKALAHPSISDVFQKAEIDRDWGTADFTPAERVFAGNSFSVVGISSGDTNHPVNAIQPHAKAVCQLRYVVGTEPEEALAALRDHLDNNDFFDVSIQPRKAEYFRATRVDPDHPLVKFASTSVSRTLGVAPILLPNLGGSLPNDCFTEILNIPTVWIPHSYPDCLQHSPDEHLLTSVVEQGLAVMTGFFWDLGDPNTQGVTSLVEGVTQ